MDKELEEAFSEVDAILKLTPAELTKKIPIQFLKTIEENKSKDYKVDIKEPIDNNNLKHETKIILGLIYRDFLVDPEERKELQIKDAEEAKKIKQEMNERYDIDNVFQRRMAKNTSAAEETALAIYKEQKEGFLKKIFNLIKGIFKNQ